MTDSGGGAATAATPPENPMGASYSATDSVVGLARTLRAVGVDADPTRVQAFLLALDSVSVVRRSDVYWAGRLTLCGHREDLSRYDAVFAAYFGDRPRMVLRRRRVPQPLTVRMGDPTTSASAEEAGAPDLSAAPAAASRTEVLRQRDIAGLSPLERAELNRLLAALALPGELRRTRRRGASRRGQVDPNRTLRAVLRAGGETMSLPRRDRRHRPRRVVLLVDVSGSMGPYADALLRFGHAATRAGGAPTEVFTVGTRLTRVTAELVRRDPERALAAVAGVVPDWSGGTRLGELIKEFLDRWGQRGMARGAVVVVLSDGWERDDPSLLGRQMDRMHRLAHRVVWANPRKARPGFAPVAAGMAAALPHVDDFVEGHSLAALERLAATIGGHRSRVATVGS